jgi:hypothetical protein
MNYGLFFIAHDEQANESRSLLLLLVFDFFFHELYHRFRRNVYVLWHSWVIVGRWLVWNWPWWNEFLGGEGSLINWGQLRMKMLEAVQKFTLDIIKTVWQRFWFFFERKVLVNKGMFRRNLWLCSLIEGCPCIKNLMGTCNNFFSTWLERWKF